MNINIKTLEKVYSECGITTPFYDFISALKAEMKFNKQQKKLKRIEEASIIHIDYEFSEVKIPIEDFIKNQIEEESDILSDVFYYEDFPDEGDDFYTYWKINDLYYEIIIHCYAEWISEWSARKNVIGDISLLSFKEIINYEIISDSRIKLK